MAAKNPLTQEFGVFVREMLERWKVPGMSLAVIDGDDIYAEASLSCLLRAWMGFSDRP
jgi:hypothetical protein